ncbi:MAG TPA: hypothetical protein VM347_42065 [Nonomuraea sp.]|nr:hypothetical protein [Nonomuraea sp.]
MSSIRPTGRARVSGAPIGTDPRDHTAFQEVGWIDLGWADGDGLVLAKNGLDELHDSPGCPGCGEEGIRGRVRVPGKTPFTVFECGHAAEMVPDSLLLFRRVQVARARRRAKAAGIIHAHMEDLRMAILFGTAALPEAALEPTFGPGYTNLYGALATVSPRTMRSLPA